MDKKLFTKMDKGEAFKCDVCGGFHLADDCEIITIKIIKGKNCELNSGIILNQIKTPTIPIVKDEKISDTPQVPQVPQVPQKNIIPPHLMKMMIPPENPLNELLGDKEVRKV
jgi:alanyl-tRNA synthetase